MDIALTGTRAVYTCERQSRKKRKYITKKVKKNPQIPGKSRNILLWFRCHNNTSTLREQPVGTIFRVLIPLYTVLLYPASKHSY